MSFWDDITGFLGSAGGGAILGGVGNLAGSVINANASGAAQQIQQNAASAALLQQQQQYNDTKNNLSSYIWSGNHGLDRLNTALDTTTAPFSMTTAQLEDTPGYKFNLDQGLKSVQSSAAARGLGSSGAALKGAANFASGLADSTYQNQAQNYYTGQQNKFNQYMQEAQLGLNGATGQASAGQNASSNISQLLTNYGNAGAAGTVSTGNQIAGGLQGASQIPMNQYFLNSLQNQTRSPTQPAADQTVH